MAIVDPRVASYLESLAAAPDPVQAEMERLAAERRFPIVGPLVGGLLELLASAIGAREVFEMGSGFGYSTLFFARAVGAGGRVVHTEWDAARSAEARELLGRAGLAERVVFEVGNALDVAARHPGPFDVVFIDVEKADYPAAFELARVRVRDGGLILTDNALWYGRVAAAPETFDDETAGVDEYNRRAAGAADLLTTIVPLRDGVAVHWKRGPGGRG